MDQQVVSAHEYLRQQGQSFVVLHPTEHLLYLGLGSEDTPRVVPHCIAEHTATAAAAQDAAGSGDSSWCVWDPDELAYEALAEVHRTLHLQVPPRPPSLDKQQQAQQRRQSLDSAGKGSQPLSPTAGGAASADQQQVPDDLFPAAKAGTVSSRQIPEGSDGFAWARTRRGPRTSHAGQQQQQQQASPAFVPHLAGTQVAALWPGDPYRAHWLMTADGHIAGLDTTPERLILERFEAVWRWALCVELGLSPEQLSRLSAVLLVHQDMTAVEVRLLAGVLLERLGCASLVVHLAPVAAALGNGSTSAVVVDMGSSGTSICCVDDAVVLPPVSSRVTLQLGLTRIAAALVGWMGCYGHWPVQLQQAAGGPSLDCVVQPQQAADGQAGSSSSSGGSVGAVDVYCCLCWRSW
ncbi:hypothetical protein COO60DRAFT_386496 [Scenedesmus sp. NREL 46B-D3]|nr:hypothetical protein COO60DRAFT_386496 [Scenedesmus sp. NREL 46B-D3]